MDQLHEELKEQLVEAEEPSSTSHAITMDDGPDEDRHGQSDNDFQSCESCGSSDKAESDGQGGGDGRGGDGANEAEMLIPDEGRVNREWLKEKNLINEAYRAGGGVIGGSGGDLDKDVDTAANEATPIISSQGTIKVQIQARTTSKTYVTPVQSRPNTP